jgi:ABC-type bacteriocin/lantibiotic exporter with double-glycine peptidase domain
MAIDASHFGEITTQLHMLWSGIDHFHIEDCIKFELFPAGPFQIIVILILLYNQMQLAIIPGIVLLLLMIPMNLFLQKIQKKIAVCIYDWNRNFIFFKFLSD